MTLGTHAVPVLCLVCPVEPAVGFKILRFINHSGHMEPFFLQGVPGNGQALVFSILKRNQVLLQRTDTECIGYLELFHDTAGTLGENIELAFALIKFRGLSIEGDFRIVEIALHRCIRCNGHSTVVIRPLPKAVFLLVTLDTGFAPGKNSHRSCGFPRIPVHQERNRKTQHNHCSGNNAGNLPRSEALCGHGA